MQDQIRSTDYIFTSSKNVENLIMLRKHIDMVPKICMATSKTVYIWIQRKQKRETMQFKAKIKQIQQKLGEVIHCVSTNDEADAYIKKYTNCRQKIIKIVKKSYLKEMQSEKEKNNPEEKQEQFTNNNLNDKYEKEIKKIRKDDEQGMIKNLKDNFQQDNTKDLPNFITLKSEVGSSNVLVKSMIAMINQKINQQTRVQLVNILRKSLLDGSYISRNLKKDWTKVESFLLDLEKQNKLTVQKSIWWYTTDSIIHSFLNNFLRIAKHPTEIFLIQPYFQDLFNSISQLHENQQEIKQRKRFVCFRGGKIAKEEVDQLLTHIGEVVQNLGFFSTSLKQNVANNFRQNVLFKIFVEYNSSQSKSNYGYAFVQQYSALKGQDEVIFNPLNSFKLVSISQKPPKDGKPSYYEIILEYGVLGKYLSKSQQQLTEDQKVYRTLASIQRNQKSQIQCQGHALVDENHQLIGSKQYWNAFYQKAIEMKYESAIEEALRYKTICLKHHGNYSEAKKLYQKYHDMIKKNYGNKNIKYADSLNGLAFIYKLLQLPEIALEFYKNSLRLKEQLLGKDSVNYALALSSIAVIYRDQNQFTESLSLFDKSLIILQKKLGKMHPHCIGNINNIATVYESLGNLRVAKEYYIQCLQLQTKLVGKTHPYYAAALHNVGRIHKSLGQDKLAMQRLQQCEKLKKKLLGQMHPDYALSLQSLAGLYIKNSEFEEAVYMLKRCLNIQKQCFGENNLRYAATLVNLGIAYLRQGKLLIAKNCFLQSLNIQYRIAGTDHLDYASTLINLAIVHKLNDNLEECIQIAQQSNQIVQKIMKDNNHLYLIQGLNLIADAFEKLKLYPNAISSYTQVCKILEKKSDCTNMQKLEIKLKIGQLLYKCQSYQKSLQLYEECEKICRQNNFEDKILEQIETKLKKIKKKLQN